MRLALVAAVTALVVTLAGIPAAGVASPRAHADASTRLLGITGNIPRFKALTGQASQVDQAFLGWGQGQSYGAPFASLLPMLAPIPMLHLGTAGKNRQEAVTPLDIAQGKGDGYLIALNQGIAAWGKGIYVRPMAEMNNAGTLYSGYRADGTPKDARHSPAAYRKAFARIYLILHGGSAAAIDAKLHALGLPDLHGGDLPSNPFPRLRVVWSPLASDNPRVPGNAAQNYYPGAAYVDVEGGDIYDERLTDTAPWAGLEALYRAARGRGEPFSVPEWGLNGVDDPTFVRHMCTFARTHTPTEMFAYYDSHPGSPYDLGSKPGSRAAYRACMTPLAGKYPDWAAANAPGGGARQITLKLTASPSSGTSPLAVTFTISARLSVPIVQWQLFFGDGGQATGAGQPPASVPHSYGSDGVYDATLIVYANPPFTPAAAHFLASAQVTAGTGAKPLVALTVTPGRTPLAITTQTDLSLPEPATSWQMAFGDGTTLQGSGPPPHFNGHTYAKAGTYRIVLDVQTAGGSFVSFMDVTVGGGAAPPATGTPTGTVLVNGAPFTGGTIPYGARVDVTNGKLLLQTDTGHLLVYGNGITALFVLVRGTDRGKPIVELRLVGGNFTACSKRTAAGVLGAAARKKIVRQLWGSGKGSFRSRGRFAAATVRGTIWLTQDRCDGTLIRVRRGRIQVNDFVKHRIVFVRAGHSYLARKR